MKMKRYIPILLILCLLAGCAGRAGHGPAPTETPAAMVAPVPTESSLPEPDWEAVLTDLRPEDIRQVSARSENEALSLEKTAALLRGAADHAVEHEDLTMNGSDTDIVWSLRVYLNSEDGDERELTLYAGLEENLVELSAGELGRLHVMDEGLYQLVRTSMDWEGIINDTWYERYKDLVDGYFDARMAGLNEFVKEMGGSERYASWELTEFIGYAGTSKVEDLGVTLFRMNAAYRTEVPEDAVHMIAGGAYVDSRLRIHMPAGLDGESVYLMDIDGQAVGFVYGEDVLEVIQDVETVRQFRQRQMVG